MVLAPINNMAVTTMEITVTWILFLNAKLKR
jgi:hypothetical protein